MPTLFTAFSVLFTISILASSTHASATKTGTNTRPFKKIFAFGDSYTDTGNTISGSGPSGFAFVSNPPYGNTFFHHPTNRYSDGRLVIDFVAEKLSMPYLPAYRNSKADKSNGVNFAVAGSTAIEHKFFERNNLSLNITPQSLQTQLYWFEKFLASQGCVNMTATSNQCKAVFDEALIWVGEIGANDYAYTIGSTVTGNTIQRLALKRSTNFVQVLHLLSSSFFKIIKIINASSYQALN